MLWPIFSPFVLFMNRSLICKTASCHAKRLLHAKQTRKMTMTIVVCGLAAHSGIVHQGLRFIRL